MKAFLAVLLFVLSASAAAVDITITLTTPQATRAAAACGKLLELVDGKDQPRACTIAEAKTFIINFLRQVVLDNEKADAQKLIVTTPFDPT